jgi:hypothetical protein
MSLPLSAIKANQFFNRLVLCSEYLVPDTNLKVIILEVRNILEEIYITLTESNKQIHENLFARIQSAALLFEIPVPSISDSHSIRIYCNKQIHPTDAAPTLAEVESAISMLSKLIWTLSGENIPSALANLKSIPLQEPKKTYIQKPELASVRLYVTGVEQGPAIGEKQRPSTIIKGESAELGEIKIFCLNFEEQPSQKQKTHPANKMADFAKMLQGYLGATVYIENLRQYGNQPNQYLTNITTNLVIAPDILLDVSDIAGCINQISTAARAVEVWADGEVPPVQDALLVPEKKTYWVNYLDNPYAYFLKKLIGTSSGPQFLKGVIVNNLLDQLILIFF